jgi:hypothetical protein
VILPRSTTLRCVPKTPMSLTVSSALTLTMGPHESNCFVESKHYLKDAGGHKHSPIGFGYLQIPASTPMGFIMVGCWYIPSLPATIVSPSRIYRKHNFRGFVSVGLLDSNEAWVTLFTRSVPTPMALSAPIFVEGYFTVTSHPPTAAQHANPLPRPVL